MSHDKSPVLLTPDVPFEGKDIWKKLNERRLSKIPTDSHALFFHEDNEDVPVVFSELDKFELTDVRSKTADGHWKEAARWVKFEEMVDEGGKRWSKPHVSVLNANSLFQLKEYFYHGSVFLDAHAESVQDVIDLFITELIKTSELKEEHANTVRQVLSRRHRDGVAAKAVKQPANTLVSNEPSEGTPLTTGAKRTPNKRLLKKLPTDAEATNILVGHVNFLVKPIIGFVRLKSATVFEELTEVPLPTRFVFIVLAPRKGDVHAIELGRALGTLMADELFRKVAYRTKSRMELKIAVSEYIHNATVLPPCSLHKDVRIEPHVVATHADRKKKFKHLIHNYKDNDDEGPHDGHGNDPALQRTGRFGGGLMADIKRKAKWYVSDYTDSFNLECVSTFCFMYFALLSPIVTFGGLLEEATQKRMAAMENLFAGAVCGIAYHLFSGQPLTIIGSTGPVLVFETIVFDMCDRFGWDYLSFRTWINLWTGIFLLIITFFDLSALVRYITRFTEESFAALIAFIFIYEAFAKLIKIKDTLDVVDLQPDGAKSCVCNLDNGTVSNSLSECKDGIGTYSGDGCYYLYDKFLMSLVLMLGTFTLSIFLKRMRSSGYLPTRVREVLSDFAVIISIAVMTGADLLVGIDTPKLSMPSSFKPTYSGRDWVISPFAGNPMYTTLFAAVPAILLCILIFLDQQITAVIVNRKEYKLKKGCGYHLDLFILSILIIIVGYLGLPIYVAATVLSINHVNSLKVETEAAAPGEPHQFLGIREQRVTGIVTFILIGVSVFMTKLLCNIAMPTLYGVFLFMGINALGTLQFFERICLLFMPMKHQPDHPYIRHVPIKIIHFYTFFQIFCLALLWTVKSIKAISIAFPVMLILMIVVRKIMEGLFSPRHLRYLDETMPPLCGSKPDEVGEEDDDSSQEESIENIPLDRRLSRRYSQLHDSVYSKPEGVKALIDESKLA